MTSDAEIPDVSLGSGARWALVQPLGPQPTFGDPVANKRDARARRERLITDRLMNSGAMPDISSSTVWRTDELHKDHLAPVTS